MKRILFLLRPARRFCTEKQATELECKTDERCEPEDACATVEEKKCENEEAPKEEAPKEETPEEKKLNPFQSVLLDGETPVGEPLAAKYKNTFAYSQMFNKMPKVIDSILAQIIDQNNDTPLKHRFGHGSNLKAEVRLAAKELRDLKDQLHSAEPLQDLCSVGSDVPLWNADLEATRKAGKDNFYTADWLLAENYFFRKIWDIFATKKILNKFDPFLNQRNELLEKALTPTMYRALKVIEKEIFTEKFFTRRELLNEFIPFIRYSMWGNRFDLASGNLSKESPNLDNSHLWDDKILVNNLQEVFTCLSPIVRSEDNPNKIVDIFVDNSGVEVINDMFLADLLVSRLNVALVRFHSKWIPWYISDFTPPDLDRTLAALTNLRQPKPLQYFGLRWHHYIKCGTWCWTAEPFLCLGRPLQRMKETDPLLYSSLEESFLAIFKGDLNYRKLVGDMSLAPGSSFEEALGTFKPCRLLALRTNKCHLVPPGIGEDTVLRLDKEVPDWRISGEYAIAQLYA